MALSELKSVKEIGRKEIFLSIARDATSGRVYCGASDFKIYGTDPLAEKPEFTEWTGHSSYVTGLAIAGRSLISGSYDGHLIWWDLETGVAQRNLEAHAKWIRRVAVSPNGQRIASVADDMVCRVWDAASGQLQWELRGHAEQTPQHFPSMLYACAFSADSTFLATADKVGHIVVWDVSTGKSVATWETPTLYTWDPKQRIHSIGGPRSLAFSPDGRLVAVGGMDQVGNIDHLEGKSRVEVYDWRKAERTHEFSGDAFKGLVERLVFHPSGEWLLGVGGDNGGFVQCFDIAGNRVAKQEKAPTHIHDAVVSDGFDRLFAAAHGKLIVWDLVV